MRHGCQRVLGAVEDEPCCKKVQVIGPAVEGHEELLVGCKLAEIPQHGPLLGEVPRKELAGDERICLKPPEPDEEGEGPGAARKARGLRIEEQAVFY